MTKPLRGKLVLDLARSMAGPMACMMLADLGARVIKVEPPGGDETRGWGPPFEGELSSYFISINRGKESVVLDLKTEFGREALRRLLRRADVLVENYRPSTAKRLGVADALRINPKLIHCTISGFGDERPAYDLIIQAEAGVMSVNGTPDGPPLKVGLTLSDAFAAHYAVQGILACPPGTHFTVTLIDSMLASLTYLAQGALATGRAPGRLGNDHPSLYPYAVFDNLAVGVANESQWRGLCRAIRRPQLAEDPRFRTNALRVKNRESLRPILLEAVRDPGLPERLRAEDVPFGVVRDVLTALRSRGIEQFVPSPLPWTSRKKAPRLGEHTRKVLRELARGQ